MQIPITNSEGIKTNSEMFDIVKHILQEVRKHKTANKMAMNAKMDAIELLLDSAKTTLDVQFGSAPYDILGATNADELIIKTPYRGDYEELKTYSFSA